MNKFRNGEIMYEQFDKEEIKKLLIGHRIKVIWNDEQRASLQLDNGLRLEIVANEGCGGCNSGWYSISNLNNIDNIITNVEFVYTNEGLCYEDTCYEIFVYCEDKRFNFLTVDGSDGNGYYGTGYSIIVKPLITEEELKKLEEKKPRKRWRAKKGEIYWFVCGDTVLLNLTENDWEEDNDRYSIGNYFQTQEEAEFHKNELIYTQMLKDYIYEHDDVKFDWNDVGQNKWFMSYDFNNKEIDYRFCLYSKHQGTIYASNPQVLKDAVKSIGEENVKKYILKVEE